VSDDLKLDKLIAELQKRRAPACSLKKFTEEAWHVVEPGVGYVGNWHADAICEHLEAVSRGQIRKLLINVPPGTAKSTFCCVMWPAWTWTFRPEWRALFATYSDALSLRDAAKTRLLLESDWYRQTFAPAWELARDTNAKGYFQNTRLGFRFSTSVGGAGTGLRGDAIVIDDPLNAPDAKSKAEREAVKFWWDQGFANRLNNMATGSRVIIMQRLHEEDLSGHVLEQGGWEHLCLPAEFESKRRCRTSIGFVDPRQTEGELLFPARFPKEVLDDEKVRQGSSGYAGQYQQRPAPEGGNRFQKAWWRFWKPDGTLAVGTRRPDGCTDAPAVPLPPRFQDVLISVDCTFKGQSRSQVKSEVDYVCAVVIGKSGANKYLLDRRHGQMGIVQTMNVIRELREAWPRARRILIEDKANGSAVIEMLQDELDGILAVEPEGGKEARAASVEPQIEAGNFYLPEGAPWIDSFVEEFALFPKGKHDDQVDATTQALVWWIAGGRDQDRLRKLGTW
jgi:predicted phage terminase large subunit-like protein